ncbi:hypothetical protein SEA_SETTECANDELA_188 [Mycobacterium phage Settecandela]|nr:hypothetical protein SEA_SETTECANDELA_188 [Mycobacterium phage Settecandela]
MTTALRTRDHQKSKVYAAEHLLRPMLERAGTPTEVSGVTLVLEPERRFVGLIEAQIYVHRVLGHPEVIAEFGPSRPVQVVTRRGDAWAHYEAGRIAIHPDSVWALRELVVLHELAHHYAPAAYHGKRFTYTFIRLVEIMIGPQAALALRLLLHGQGAH